MIQYHVDAEHKVVSARFTGDVSFAEMLEWHRALAADPRYSKEFSGIADMRRANMLVSPEEVARIADFSHEHDLVAGRWALLVETPMETALGMIYSQEAEGRHEMQLFATEEGASTYLGLDVAALLDF